MSKFIYSEAFLMPSQPPPHRGLDVALPHTMNPPKTLLSSGSPRTGLLRPGWLCRDTAAFVWAGPGGQPREGRGQCSQAARDECSEPGIEAPLCGAPWGKGCCQLPPCDRGGLSPP